MHILETALSTLLSIADDVEIKSRKTMIALHVQPKALSFVRFIEPMIAPQLISLAGKPLTTAAVVVNWGDWKITLDGSSYVANGIFIRSEREFGPSSSYGAIAERLKADEGEIIGVLGLEVE
jgi:hypothetical protein